MQKALETVFDFPPPSGPGSKCRLRIFRAEGGKTIIVISHIPGSRGTSITNAIEEVATEVMRKYPEHFSSPDREPVWVQNYPQGSLLGLEEEALVHFVTFKRAGGVLVEPRWEQVFEDHVEAPFLSGLLNE